MAAEATKTGDKSLHRSVYGQPPGKTYKRTGNLRALFRVTPSGSGLRVKVRSGVSYASQVEGITPNTVSLNPYTGKVSGLGGWQASTVAGAYMGRGPGRWQLPGPHVSPAAMRALWIARRELNKTIKEVGNGRS